MMDLPQVPPSTDLGHQHVHHQKQQQQQQQQQAHQQQRNGMQPNPTALTAAQPEAPINTLAASNPQQQAAYLDPLHAHAIMVAGNLGQSQGTDLVGVQVPVAGNQIIAPSIPQQNSLPWLSAGGIAISLPQAQLLQQATTQSLPQHEQQQQQQQAQAQQQAQSLQPQLSQQQQRQQQKPQQPLPMQTFFHQIQKTKQPLMMNADLLQSGVATIVAGPSGQQMILNPTAAASLFDSQSKNNKNANASQNPHNVQQLRQQQGNNNVQHNIYTTQSPQSLNKVIAHPQQAGSSAVAVVSQQLQQQQQSQFVPATENGARKRNLTEIGGQHDNMKRQCIGNVGSGYMSSTNSMTHMSSDTNNMTPDERRRHERNLREQQRSHKISQQIKELRTVLTDSKVPFKPNKFSILMSVADYIKQLQNRSTLLDGEMSKLLNTIRQSSVLVNSGQTSDNNQQTNGIPNEIPIGNDAEMLFVQSLNFRSIFEQASIAFGIASLDGRILGCNSKFELVSGYSKEELEKQNVFNLLERTEIEHAYKAVGKFLKDPKKDNDMVKMGKDGNMMDHFFNNGRGFWSGKLVQPNLQMNITLTRTADGAPKFLNCALSAVDDDASTIPMVKNENGINA